MVSHFDPELIEFHLHTDTGRLVDAYKTGGGTLGRAYEGFWGYRISSRNGLITCGDDLHTGTPKTHQEAALLVLDIFDTQE